MEKLSEERRGRLITTVRYYAAATQFHFGWNLVSDWLDDDIADAIGDATNVAAALTNVRKWVMILHRHKHLLDYRNWKGYA